MPFYEYRCSACRHAESLLESMNAAQQKTCPQCGKRRAFKRLISAAGFQLKGSGWYATDFKNKDKPKAADKKPPEDKKDGDKKPADDKKDGDKKTNKDSGGKKADSSAKAKQADKN